MTSVVSASGREDLRRALVDWCASHMSVENLSEAEAMLEEGRQIACGCILETAMMRLGVKATHQVAFIPCECGGRARFAAYRQRYVKSAYAEARVKRAYYHCSGCGVGVSPWDKAQGMTERAYT